MTDDELRELLHQAHRGDHPPPFRRPRPARRRAWVPAAALVAAMVAIWLAWPRSRPPRSPGPAPVAELTVRWRAPLDFLLEVPGADLLRETPHFDLKGTWP